MPEVSQQLMEQRVAVFQKTVLDNPWVVQKPFGKQAVFLMHSDVRDVLFGGAAGSSKTSALLMGAAQYVNVPGYHAIIFRNTERQLLADDGLVQRSKQWWDKTKAKFNGNEFLWTFPGGGTVRFAYLELDKHAEDHRGTAYSYVAFDEATLHSSYQLSYLYRSLRKPTTGPLSEVPLRMRLGSNPGGPGHAAVRDLYVPDEYMAEADEDARFNRLWWKRGADGVERLFVPARLKDNPHLDYESYVANLMQLDPVTRAQQLHGDWRDFSGGRFLKEWFGRRWFRHGDYYYISGEHPSNHKGWHKSQVNVFMAVDPAGTKKKRSDFTAAGVFGACPDGDLLVLHLLHRKFFVHEMLPEVAALAKTWQCQTVGMESDNMQRLIVAGARKEPGMPMVTPLFTNNKGKLHRAFPAIHQAEQGKIVLPEQQQPWVSVFLTNLLAWQGDAKLDAHDDIPDILSWACAMQKSVGPRWGGQDVKVAVPEARRLEDRRFETRQHTDRGHYGRGR